MTSEWLGTATGSAILMVEDALGGGVQKHVRDLVALFGSRTRLMVLAPVPGGLVRVNHTIPDVPSSLYFDGRRELAALRRFLSGCGLSRIHYHTLIQLPWDIAPAIEVKEIGRAHV